MFKLSDMGHITTNGFFLELECKKFKRWESCKESILCNHVHTSCGTFIHNFKSRLTTLSVLKTDKAQKLAWYKPGFLLEEWGEVEHVPE